MGNGVVNENGAEAARTAAAWVAHREAVYQYLRHRLAPTGEAEDLTQEAFLRLHREQPVLEQPEQVRAWLLRTAHNLLVDTYRARREELPWEEAELPAPSDPPASLRQLEPCIPLLSQQIPENYRWALLWDIDGVPQEEIARRLNVTLSGAKSRVQRARGLLQQQFERTCSYRFDGEGGLVGYTPKDPDGPCGK